MDRKEILENAYNEYRNNNKEGWYYFDDEAFDNFINFSGIKDVTKDELRKLYSKYNCINQKVRRCTCGSYNTDIDTIDNQSYGDSTAYGGMAYCKDCGEEWTFLNSID